MATNKERITIEYCEHGIYTSDQGAWEWLYQLQNNILKNGVRNQHITVANELMVELTRLLVVRKIIEPHQIIYKYKDQYIKISKDGGLKRWPKGFCDNWNSLLDELIDFRQPLKERIDGSSTSD